MVLDTPTALLGSLYGRLLVAKVGLFGAMLALASVNRFRLVPALTADPTTDAANSLRRHLIAELALGLGVLAIVSIIGTLDPTA